MQDEPTLTPANNPTTVVAPLTEGEVGTELPGAEDEAFGMDFPVQAEAPLITTDALLDDPVASGNDALVYSSPDDDEEDDDDGEP